MTDHLPPDDPDAPAVDLAGLDPKLQLALRQVANVEECCRTLLELLDAMPVIEGLTTTIPEEWQRRPRFWIHDAIRACERLPGNWQRDVKRAWQLLGDAVNLYNQTVSSMGRYVERVQSSLNGRLTTPAHKWARRFLEQYAGDLEQVSTLLDGSEIAFDELKTNSTVPAHSSDPLAEEASMFEVMEMMETLADIVLGGLAKAGHIPPVKPELISDGKLLPQKLDSRPVAEILRLLPETADDDAAVAVDETLADIAVDDSAAVADDTATDDRRYIDGMPVMHPTPSVTLDESLELTSDVDLATVNRRRLLFSPDEVWAKLRVHGFDSATTLVNSRPLDSLLTLADGLGVTATQLEQLWWTEAKVREELAEWAHSLLIRSIHAELPVEGWRPDSEASSRAMASAFNSWGCYVEAMISDDDRIAMSESFKAHLYPGWLPTMPEDALSALLRKQIDGLVNATMEAVEEVEGRDGQPDTDQSVTVHLADETVAARCRRTIRRYQWAVGALCAAAVVILVAAGMMTDRAQERARDAAKRADVRIADAESKAEEIAEQARAALQSPMRVDIEQPGEEPMTWFVRPGDQIQIGERSLTMGRLDQ